MLDNIILLWNLFLKFFLFNCFSKDPTIRAAWVSGFFQILPAVATIFVGYLALRSWRHSILGGKQVQLAEECLMDFWKLNNKLDLARRTFLITNMKEFESNVAYRNHQQEQFEKARAAMAECFELLEIFKLKFKLAEFYIGKMPSSNFSGETRIFKGPYDLISEYDEIITQLNLMLLKSMPGSLFYVGGSEKNLDNPLYSSILFFGFSSENFQDEFSARIRNVRVLLERRIRRVLGRSSIIDIISDRMVDVVLYFYRRRVKKVAIDPHLQGRLDKSSEA